MVMAWRDTHLIHHISATQCSTKLSTPVMLQSGSPCFLQTWPEAFPRWEVLFVPDCRRDQRRQGFVNPTNVGAEESPTKNMGICMIQSMDLCIFQIDGWLIMG